MGALTRRAFSKNLATVSVLGSGVGRAMVGFAQVPSVGKADEIAGLTLSEAAARMQNKALTSRQLTQACLDRIRIYQPKLDAYITVLSKRALAQADAMDAERAAGKVRGPLHGIPVALKDNIDTAGIRTTAASMVYDDRVPTEDATVTRRLTDAGTVLLGKANMDEFADAVSYFGSARNPWGLDRDPSGSSSGSASLVSATMGYGALGTDTGGSVRLPSAYCGTVGLKPTYGLVPIRGIVPLVLSLDHCGPITRSVEDNAMMMNVLAGYDKYDITSVEHPKEDYVEGMKQPVSGLRIGIPRAPFYDHLDNDTERAMEDGIAVLDRLTQGSKDVSLPSTGNYPWATLNDMIDEMYAYHEELFKTRASKYMLALRLQLQALKDSLDTPAGAGSEKVSEYIRHHWELESTRRTIDDAFTDFDLVVVPTLRIIPQKLSYVIDHEEHPTNHNPDVLDLDNCTPFNVWGLPAISVPCGFARDGMPIGLMIAGPRFSESKVLALAHAYEQETKWDTKRPPLKPDMPVPTLRPALSVAGSCA